MINVFLVEDNISILKLYHKFLNFGQYNVIDSAMDGREAIFKYKNFIVKPDIIIMDAR